MRYVWLTIRLVAFVLGFFGAFSFVRSISQAFNIFAFMVYGRWFHFGLGMSASWFIICVAVFAFSIWVAKPPKTPFPLRRVYYIILLIVCGVGFFVCMVALQMYPSQITMYFLPKIAYTLAMVAFGELVARINASSAKYEQAQAARIRAEQFKTELITNVSHDIRTPLTSIINYIDLLKNEGLEGQSAQYIQILDKKAARLKTLIDDLMDATKASTGNVRVELQEINLGEIVGQAAGELEDRFAEQNITLVIRQPDAPVLVKADSRHLFRVLENLFSNASKYSLSGTRIFAEISSRDAILNARPSSNRRDAIYGVRFTLQNTAKDPIELSNEEITQQFMRGDKARQTEGSGLGLYIAKSLVELMGGTLNISIIGDLFQVEITLPLGSR